MCKESKVFEDFAKSTTTKDGLQRGCRKCKSEQYQKNSGKYKEASKKSRERRYAKLVEIKDKPCMDCGIKYPACVMEFDHVDDNKISNISNLMLKSSWQVILEEIEKCELVCANCHRLRTFNRLKNKQYQV